MKLATIRTPKTLWDHIKHRYAPRWFLRWFPVDYVVYEQIEEWHCHSYTAYIDKPLDNPRL